MGKIDLNIHGMHCRSCEVLLEQNIKKISGVERVHVDHTTGKAVIYSNKDVSLLQVQDAVKNTEYTVELVSENSLHGSGDSHSSDIVINRNHVEAAGILIILVGLYLLLKQFNIIPSNIGLTENVSYGLALAMGVLASLSTCLAVTGGLLVGISAKYAEQHPEMKAYEKFKPHIYFNVGRILSYTLLGGLVGFVGASIALTPFMNGLLTIIVSFVMLLLGLQLLNIFPSLQKFNFRMPKYLAHKIHENHTEGKAGPFVLGALTFFLPCGFTQALQLYALTTGSFIVGALTMFSFSLGTLPALLTLGAVSSYTEGSWKHYFLKIAGGVVVLFGVLSLTSGLTLTGIQVGATNSVLNVQDVPLVVEGKQTIEMAVKGLSYTPSNFVVKKGIPVEWKIDGSGAQGCAQIITVPKLGITKRLTKGITTITFTPTSTGNIPFTCSMGMAGPGNFQVVA